MSGVALHQRLQGGQSASASWCTHLLQASQQVVRSSKAPKATVVVEQCRAGGFSTLLWGNTEGLLMTVAASQGTVFALLSLAFKPGYI